MQLTMPIIFCLRAQEVPLHLGGGWKVQQDKNFLYEWTVALTLHPDTPGMPRYDMVDAKKKPLWKVQDQHRHLFPEGQLITAEAGAALQAWRMTDAAVATTSVVRTVEPPTPQEIADALIEKFEACETQAALDATAADDLHKRQIAWLEKKHPELAAQVSVALKAAAHGFSKPSFAPAGDGVGA